MFCTRPPYLIEGRHGLVCNGNEQSNGDALSDRVSLLTEPRLTAMLVSTRTL